MLDKQRKNQANDPRFMDAAWKNMAEILDQEMPVEKKERRIGWLSIAAMLVIGFVGGITVIWGLQKHQSTPMASNHSTDTYHQTERINSNTDLEINQVSTNSQKEENPVITPNNNIVYNPKTTHNQTAITSNTKNTLDVLTISENTSEKRSSTAEVIFMNTIAKIENTTTPLSELPTLVMSTLPSKRTSFTIDNDLDLPKNKWRTGVYAGAIIAGKKSNGLEAVFRVERKLGHKWAVETGLGLRATQLAFISKNEGTEFSDAFLRDEASLPTDPETNLNEADRQEIVNNINADAPDYHLTVPLSFVYRPMGKLRLALGMSWAYRLNKLKDASSLGLLDSSINLGTEASLNKNSFSKRFNDFRLNLGVGYQFNARTGIELAYSKRLPNSISGSTNSSNTAGGFYSTYDEDGSPLRFFQLGLMYYFSG